MSLSQACLVNFLNHTYSSGSPKYTTSSRKRSLVTGEDIFPVGDPFESKHQDTKGKLEENDDEAISSKQCMPKGLSREPTLAPMVIGYASLELGAPPRGRLDGTITAFPVIVQYLAIRDYTDAFSYGCQRYAPAERRRVDSASLLLPYLIDNTRAASSQHAPRYLNRRLSTSDHS